jgi:hypothetical protein
MFKVSPASLQTFIDTPNCVLAGRVQYSTVHIPNVFCDGHLQIISCVGLFEYTVIIRCTETFWSSCTSIELFEVKVHPHAIIIRILFNYVLQGKSLLPEAVAL